MMTTFMRKRCWQATTSLVLVAGMVSTAQAGPFWDWLTGKTPAAQPAIPVGPPIYTPNPTPQVVGYAPATVATPATSVPAAAVAPSLTTTAVAPAPAVVAPATHCGLFGNKCAPAVAAPVTPAPVVTNYVPPSYQTTWVQVPTTTYRAIVTTDPVTGLPINAVTPCTTNVYQARRVSFWGSLFGRSAPPAVATTVAGYPTTVTAYPLNATVTKYGPPVVTQYGPAPVTSYAMPTQIVAPAVTAPAAVAPATTVPPAYPSAGTMVSPAPAGSSVPADCPPTLNSPPPSYPPGGYPSNSYPSTPMQAAPPSQGTEPADQRPQLDPQTLQRDNGSSTLRAYPREHDNEPVVPVPSQRESAPEIQPPKVNESQSSQRALPSWVPLTRPAERPASSGSKLKLLPDPDAQPLELRRNDIPNLIKPGDRTTDARPVQPALVSVPIQWPSKSAAATPAVPASKTTVHKPVSKQVPASEWLDDSGWKSIAK